MKTRNNIKTLLCAFVMTAMAVGSLQAAPAAETGKNVSKEISDLRSTVVSAEVLLTSGNLEARHSHSEKDLQGMARKYKVSNKEALDSLINIMANAEIVEAPSPQDGYYDARIGVYLHTKDGSTVRLITGPDDEPAIGTLNGTTPVALKKGIEADLQIWAASHQSSRVAPVTRR
jgi:hypothetical protein